MPPMHSNRPTCKFLADFFFPAKIFEKFRISRGSSRPPSGAPLFTAHEDQECFLTFMPLRVMASFSPETLCPKFTRPLRHFGRQNRGKFDTKSAPMANTKTVHRLSTHGNDVPTRTPAPVHDPGLQLQSCGGGPVTTPSKSVPHPRPTRSA